jgi:aspartyl-tRNA synthetase
MFEYSEEEERFVAMHHPFTAPMDEDVALLASDKKNCRAKAYDIVLNGSELGGGSIRINTPDMQKRMFTALGFTEEEAMNRFGHLIEAFKYGAPPHGGIAYGLDRIIMHLAGLDNIRDVIAFPKVQNASEPMTSCPDVVDDVQLKELGISLSLRV